MAGTISRKFRGVHVKIWTKLEIVLLSPGLRVDNHQRQGLLCKTATANRYPRTWAAGSGSNSLDLMKLRSNLERWFWIGRIRFNRARGGGGARQRRAPAAGDRRRRPISAFPGSKRARSGLGGIYAARVMHWWRWGGGSGLRASRSSEMAARRRRARRRWCVPIMGGPRI